MSLLATHIAAQAQLRALLERLVKQAWTGLPGYNEHDVPAFLQQVVPVVTAAQRQSAALTDAYLARALERQPLGVPATLVTGAALRAGTTPAQVYRRPFVTVWTALKSGGQYADATAAGLAQATGSAAMDVQLASRATYAQVQARDTAIRGYRRVADPGACAFCTLVDGAFVKSANAMPLHNRCGCGLEPILTAEPATPLPEGVAIAEHGELGPLLVDPSQHFTHV